MTFYKTLITLIITMLYTLFSTALAQPIKNTGHLAPESLYQISSSWKNQNRQVVQLKDFSGQPLIIGMVYTSCPHTCPMTVSKIQEIERKLAAKKFANYKVVLASFDTVKDRPSDLKVYMKKRKLDESKWSMLSADRDATVRELALVLAINYKKLDDGEFAHSNTLTVLDKGGVIIDKIESLNASADILVEKTIHSK